MYPASLLLRRLKDKEVFTVCGEKILSEMSNNETLAAIEEVRELKNDPKVKAYDSFAELLEEVRNEI